VLFVHYPDGRATGDAVVMIGSEEEAANALLKHKAMMGPRYIELFRSTTAEVQQVLKRSQDPKNYQSNFKEASFVPLPVIPADLITGGNRKDCIRLRNLPFESSVEQILEFLGMHSQHIVQQGVHMIFNAQGQPSGEAFIQFDSELSSFNVTNHKNGKYMFFSGKKFYIEVLQCSGEEMNLVLLGVLPSNLTCFNSTIEQSGNHKLTVITGR
jgi:epithelial splicing regulatory protein 1/2